MENKVGYFRRNLFVPLPVVTDLLTTNQALLEDSERHWDRPLGWVGLGNYVEHYITANRTWPPP